MSAPQLPYTAPSGCGFSLRREHYGELAVAPALAPWVEVVSDNFLGLGGKPWALLQTVRARAPVALHGVELYVGDTAPLSRAYLTRLRALIERIEPAFVSDHLAWGSQGGGLSHDLLPMPHIPEAVAHVAARVRYVQDFLGRQIALENVSSYARFAIDQMPEWEFVAGVAEAADCLLLVDVNNICVNAHNHGFDPHAYIDALPPARVQQIHVAGHTDLGTHRLDTHTGPVPEEVWALYRRAVARFGPVPTMVEWDEDVPPIATMQAEMARAEREAARAAPPARARA